jgi:hypothetical protein
MKIKSFTLYEEYYELITLLSDTEQAELLLAITKFMFEDVEPELNDRQMKIFKNLRRPLEISKNNSKRSIGNGAPVGNKNAKKTNQKQTEEQTKNKPNIEPNDQPKTNTSNDVYVNVNNNVLESNKRVIGGKEKTFKKPTIDEIADYCDERDNNIDPNEFYDFYESKDWYIGKNKMKDWKACVRTWERRTEFKNMNLENVPEWFEENL